MRVRLRVPQGLTARLILLNSLVVVCAVLCTGFGMRLLVAHAITSGALMAEKEYPAFERDTLRFVIEVAAAVIVLAGGASVVYTRSLVAPLARIRKIAESVAGGDYRQRVALRRADELGALAQAVDRMTEGLGKIEHLRRELVADVAHELRTPLTSTQGLLLAMRDGLLPPDAGNLERACAEVGRLERLVNAVQQLSRSDAVWYGALARAPVQVGALVEDVVAQFSPAFEEAGQLVAIRQPPAPVVVEADRDRLVEVLVNLLDNAVKYTPAGGRVDVAVSAWHRGGCEVSVRSDGRPVGAEDLPHLFERFYRADKSRSRRVEGSGIGLAVVKNLVEAHGGEVGAESGPEGNRFWFRLPDGAGRGARTGQAEMRRGPVAPSTAS